MELVLASASPRRQELMRLITDKFTVCPVDVDETLRPGEEPESWPGVWPWHGQGLMSEVTRLSLKKAKAAMEFYPDAVCIGADTLVTIDGKAIGKPVDEKQAAGMLRMLRGRTHEVLTGLSVAGSGSADVKLSLTSVTFRRFDDDELAAYIATGEPMDKAGAYGIQGKGALLIDKIDGDFYGVMGLPVARLNVMLREMGAL